MKKPLKHILIGSALSICLMSLLAYPGNCQSPPTVEVLFSPEQGEEILKKPEEIRIDETCHHTHKEVRGGYNFELKCPIY